MRVKQRVLGYVALPVIRRVAFHARRVTGHMSGRVTRRLLLGLLLIIVLAASLVTVIERPRSNLSEFADSFTDSIHWAVTTVLGVGEADFVTSPAGFVVSWLLVLFGVAIVGSVTGVLVGFVIDVLIKEGQGMGASGYRDHIVVCGWNPTARELVEELSSDDYEKRIVVLDDTAKNLAGSGTYFIQGDIGRTEDLQRAGIEEAAAAIVFPRDGSNEADMRSLVAVLAIESIAPQVRTVNNPAHVEHFRRAGRRDPRDVPPDVPPAGPIRPVSGAHRDRQRHRGRGRRLGALPRDAAGPSTPAWPPTTSRRRCATSTTPLCSQSLATAVRTSTRRRTSASPWATTPWSSLNHWARCPRCRSTRPELAALG